MNLFRNLHRHLGGGACLRQAYGAPIYFASDIYISCRLTYALLFYCLFVASFSCVCRANINSS